MDVLIDKLLFQTKTNDTSLMRNLTGSQSFLKDNILSQSIPSDYSDFHDLFESNSFVTDFNTSSTGHKFNICSIFKSVNPNLLPIIPKLSPPTSLMQDYSRLFTNLSKIQMDMSHTFEHLFVSRSPEMSQKDNIESKGSIADHLILSMTASPVKDTQLNIRIAKKKTKPFEVKKVEYNLSQQLANKKTKELQKRSKNRRRRQKKNKGASNNSDEKIKINITETSSKDGSSKINHCDLICDVTLPSEANISIMLPKISTFLVTVESADEDSDWDSNCDTDWITDDSEFRLCGLYLGNFTAIGSCANSSDADNTKICDKEINAEMKRLKKVNQQWEESTKHLEAKQKSKALVSFATEDSLVTICPVEAYDRKGEWEIYATERLRFRKRVKEMEDILSPCLKTEHRAKIYKQLHKCNL